VKDFNNLDIIAQLFNAIIVIRMKAFKELRLFPFTIAHLNKHNREIFLLCKTLVQL